MVDESWPARCPECGGAQVASILYGLPDFDEKLEQGLDSGRIVLGGCTIWNGMPEWHCVGCKHRWGRIELPDVDEADD